MCTCLKFFLYKCLIRKDIHHEMYKGPQTGSSGCCPVIKSLLRVILMYISFPENDLGQ